MVPSVREQRQGSRAFTVIGVLVIVLGIVHEVSVVIIYGSDVWRLLGRGFDGSRDNPASEDAGFWSFLFGVMVIAAGQQILWAGRRHHVISVVPAIFLLGIGLLGGWIFPFAPFWGAAVLGAVTLVLVLVRTRGDGRGPMHDGGDALRAPTETGGMR